MSITSSALSNSDNNCFHNQSGSVYIDYNGSSSLDLAAWQSDSGFDGNSVDSDPQFASNTDLHAMLVLLNGAALPFPGLTVDFDHEPRDPVMPDIGADEFVAPEKM